jgi:hypothetical protein
MSGKHFLRAVVVLGLAALATVQTGGFEWLGRGRGNRGEYVGPLWLTALCAIGLIWFAFKDRKRSRR